MSVHDNEVLRHRHHKSQRGRLSVTDLIRIATPIGIMSVHENKVLRHRRDSRNGLALVLQ